MTAIVLGVAVALALGEALRLAAERGAIPRRLPPLPWPPRRAALAALVLGAAAVSPVLAGFAGLGWWVRRHQRRAQAQRAWARDVRAALPEVVDLLILTTTAGLSLPVAHPLVARHAPAPVGAGLVAAAAAVAAGQARADALLHHLAPMGERARALADVLVDHLRYGVPLLPALERTGLELRLERRRAAELDARRVPVRLLAPLVTCVLPAFALLTVVPLLAASLEALPT